MTALTKLRGQILAAMGLLLTTACGPAQSPAPQANAGPRRGGALVVGFTADMTSVNPYLAANTSMNNEVATVQFLRLLDELGDFEDHPPTLEPRLAERWEESADKKTVTFHLRPGVVWSDGEPVTAEDVRFTWQAQTDPTIAWDSSYYKQGIGDVEVVDPLTVRFHMARPSVNQLTFINEGEIIPKHAWSVLPFSEWRKQADWFREHLVVAGPYKLASWKPQQEIVLERNERYFQPDRPYIDRLILRIVPEQSTLLTQVLTGDLDMMMGLSLGDVAKVEQSPKHRVSGFWSRSYAFVAWNLRRPLFSEREVRRALTLAIDRQAIVDTVLRRYGRIAVGPVLTNVWAFDRSLLPLPYDLAEAKRSLAAAGWRDSDGDGILDRAGKKFSFDLSLNTGNQQRADIAVLIQEQLRKVGIEAIPRPINFNVLNERANAGDYDAAIVRWAMPTDMEFTFMFHSKSILESSNIFGYRNPEMDRLLEAAQQEVDLGAFTRELREIQQIVVADQPLTYLYESQDLLAAHRRVQNVQSNVIRRLFHCWEWWLEPAS